MRVVGGWSGWPWVVRVVGAGGRVWSCVVLDGLGGRRVVVGDRGWSWMDRVVGRGSGPGSRAGGPSVSLSFHILYDIR